MKLYLFQCGTIKTKKHLLADVPAVLGKTPSATNRKNSIVNLKIGTELLISVA